MRDLRDAVISGTDAATVAEHARQAGRADAKFRAMFDQGQVFAALLSPEGAVQEANRLAVEGCGFLRGDIIGKPFWECGWWQPSAAAAENVRQACAEAGEGKTFRGETPYFLADGTRRMVYVTITPVLDDSGLVLFLNPTGIDITDRLDAERERDLSREQSGRERRLYEAILSNTPDLAYVFDLQHRFIYANDGLLKMWGKTWDEASGKTCLELGYEPWHAEMHNREIDQIAATGQPIRGVVPFNGSFGRRMYDYILVPVLNDRGEVEAVAGTTRDVTESQEAAEKLQHLAEELAATDRRKTEFLAMLAHELRNPLAPIRNAAEIIRGSQAEPQRVLEAVEIMQRQLGQMVRLVDDLMDVSRISRGHIGLQRAPVDLAEVLRQASEVSRPLLATAGQELSLGLPAGPLPLRADAVRLTQVFSNLLDNASKYSPPGSTILLQAQREGGEVRVSVRDPGIGIPAEALPGIFDMFTQVDRSLERPRSGLGIGLALVKTLVELHGGSVEGRSDGPGQGSEFHVRLPLMADAGTPTTTPVAAPATISGRRILVVDDNTDAAATMAQLLELLGNQTRLAYDGEAAVEIAAEFQPELILMDIGLPRLNGYDACRLIRKRGGSGRPIIVALTGWGQDHDREQSAQAGFDAHLVKPVQVDTLMQLLTRLLPAGSAP